MYQVIASAIVLLMGMLMQPVSETGKCGSTAVKLPDGSWVLSCTDGCVLVEGPNGPQPNPCIVESAQDPVGQYSACFCTSGAATGEPACCHSVLRNGMPDSRGTCNPSNGCAGGDCVDANSRPNITDYLCAGGGGN